MKKLVKIAANFIALAVTVAATLGLSACEDIKTLELSLSLYDNSASEFYAVDDVKFTVDLYRHLAPKTVDKVLEHINNDFYNGAIFYEENGMIMLGDYKFEGGELKQNLIENKLPSEIYGEFKAGGTTGSNLLVEKGSVGLWRSYYATDNSYKTSDNARNSGRATWFIPTSANTSYDDYFCVFAKYDTEDAANAKAISAISAIFNNADYYTQYVVYFTGTYDSAKADENYGLSFHALTKADFDALEEEPEVFEAKGQQLVSFNKKTIKVPNIVKDNKISAQVNSIAQK